MLEYKKPFLRGLALTFRGEDWHCYYHLINKLYKYIHIIGLLPGFHLARVSGSKGQMHSNHVASSSIIIGEIHPCFLIQHIHIYIYYGELHPGTLILG
jgi:hypothetical protein